MNISDGTTQEAVTQQAQPDEAECYHCGLPVPSSSHYQVMIDGVNRRMCCVGCEAVAQSIVGSGLTDYYRHRDALPESQKEALPEALQQLGLFDHPDFQKTFVHPVGEHEKEASLILEGITCAACVWLNEKHLLQQPGVTAVNVNYATRRARIRWDGEKTRLSDILVSVQQIGYRAYPYDAQRSEQVATRERRSMLWRLAVAGLGMMQVMMYAIPAYLAGDGDMTAADSFILRWASLVLTLPVVFYSAAPFFSHAWRDIRLRRLGMDVPVAIGVGSAFLASLWATLTNGPDVYFDSVVMFVFFLLCGRYLELMARQKAVRGVEEMGKVLPVFTWKVLPDGQDMQVPVSELVPGDRVRVRPGEVIPADGVVLEGISEADESLLTGESRPLLKKPGMQVTGGCINVSSPIVFKVCQVGSATRLAAIRQLMERASAEKPRIASVADYVVRWFIPILLVLALLTLGLWYLIDPQRALWIFVSVLVVACPCALSLATPTALTVATDTLSRRGVLITRGHAIEGLAGANHYLFDKTGTLTYGEMRVDTVLALDAAYDENRLITLAASLEQASEHVIAAGIRTAAAGQPLQAVGALRSVTGQGVEGDISGRLYRIGHPGFVAELAASAPPPQIAEIERNGGTVVALGTEGQWLALLRMMDLPREDAQILFQRLHAEHIPVTVLSGDAQAAVVTVAAYFQITDFHAGMSPQDKYQFVTQCQQQKNAQVVMVGDGVNDAPVLAQAHVSVAMGAGTDLARNQSDIVLLSNSLAGLSEAVDLSRRTLRIIRQNLWWSFFYNFASVPLAMMGLVTPWMAGIGMAASSLLVVLNALRLQRGRGSVSHAVPAAEEALSA